MEYLKIQKCRYNGTVYYHVRREKVTFPRREGIHVRWPDGAESLESIVVRYTTRVVDGFMGESYPIGERCLYIKTEIHGSPALVNLTRVEVCKEDIELGKVIPRHFDENSPLRI